jgi:hypothetical protein
MGPVGARPLRWAIPGRPGVPSGCRIGPGESGPLPAMDPAGTRDQKAARRPYGRVTVLVAVLIAVLVAVLVTAPGDGPRPGGGPRRGREPEGDAAASWPSNGISSGISNGISNGTRGREGWGDGAGRREIGRVRLSSSSPVGKGLADLRIRGAGSKPRQWAVVFAATWAAAKDGGGDRWQRPGPSRRAPKAPGDRLSPAEQRH